MDMTAERYIQRLNESLHKKKEFLLEILSLTQIQSDAIAEDGLDNLGKLIEKKQQIIDAIDKLDEEFGIYFQRFKSTAGISRLEQLDEARLGGAAAAGARELKKLTAEIMETIKRISDIEQGNSEKSKKLLGEIGKEIRNINQGKKVNNAYSPAPVRTPSYFVDKKK